MTTYPAYDLGCIYLDLKRPDEALAAFELALSFDPNFIEAQEKIDTIRRVLATTLTDTPIPGTAQINV